MLHEARIQPNLYNGGRLHDVCKLQNMDKNWTTPKTNPLKTSILTANWADEISSTRILRLSFS